jgi:hypothetical protein
MSRGTLFRSGFNLHNVDGLGETGYMQALDFSRLDILRACIDSILFVSHCLRFLQAGSIDTIEVGKQEFNSRNTNR